MSDDVELKDSRFSWAYMEFMNLVDMCKETADYRRRYLLKRTMERLLPRCYPQERQDVILKLTSIKW